MRWAAIALPLWLAACSFQGPPGPGDGDGDGDGDLDCADFGTRRFFEGCDVSGITSPVDTGFDAGTYRVDTSAGIVVDPDGASFDLGAIGDLGGVSSYVIIATRFDLPPTTTLRITGDRPLAIIAWEGVAVRGELDLHSTFSADASAFVSGGGATDAGSGLCIGAIDGEYSEEGGSGAAGGAFGGPGGGGGDSGQGMTTGATAGQAILAADLTLQGGCAGGDGGDGELMVPGGAGAPGGGALLISTLGDISIQGVVDANGAGGRAPTLDKRSGGGGGGSGGLIALEASAVAVPGGGVVVANGGGGGGGCNNVDANCTPGSDPERDGVAAPGGGSDQAGDGGDGGALENDGVGQDGSDNGQRGGGGGGGGGGHILIIGDADPSISGLISPAELVVP